MFVQSFGFFLFAGYRTIFPLILEFGFLFSELEVISSWSFIFTIGMLIAFLTRTPAGIIADRLQYLPSLFLGSGIALLSIIGILFTQNILILALLFALLRTGTHFFPLVSRGFVNGTNKDYHGRLNSMILLSANFASIIAPLFLIFWLEISLTVLIIVTVIFILLGNLIFILKVPPKETNSLPVKNQLKIAINEIWTLRIIVLLFVLNGMINGIYTYIQVPYSRFVLLLQSTEIGLIVGFIQLFNLFILFYGGKIVDKIGTKFVILIGLLIEAIGSLIIIIGSRSVITFALSQIFISSGILIIIVALVTNITLKASKNTIGTTFGAISSFFFLGMSFIPILAGELYLLNPIFPFYLILILSITFLLSILILTKKKDVFS